MVGSEKVLMLRLFIALLNSKVYANSTDILLFVPFKFTNNIDVIG